MALSAMLPAGSVRGVVIDAAKKRPVDGASVLLIRPDAPAQAAIATTDDRGRFIFTDVAPASYRLRAEHDGYLRGDLTSVVDVGEGESPDVTLTLTPTAVISGRVSDQFGEPASRVFVRALSPASGTLAAQARTNDLGEYRLFALPPGAYLVSAERYPGPTIETNVQVGSRTLPGTRLVTRTPPCPDCPGEGQGMQLLSSPLPTGSFIDPRALTGETYPTVFYPGTADRSAATPIKAAAGARIDAIDLTLVVSR
jgi:hypothetical protein